jgi:diketogulonate reductase-like aldo/keto reductase
VVIQGALASAAAAVLPQSAPALETCPGMRRIPASGEPVPLVGLGSWITFNVGDDSELRDECAAVMAAFFEAGGRMIDSSPMYGSSQPTIGYALKKLGYPRTLVSADKVWISNPASGPEQLERTRTLWGVPRIDVLQVHNLLAWERHLPTLVGMKMEGHTRYVGVTTSEGRRHRELESIMTRHQLDFIQVTYNVLDREVEQRILPLARERCIAVIVNRPFRQGDLIARIGRRPLPPWAAEVGARSWAQFLLKFIISHPAVTCAIPATTRVDHVRENMDAARGPLPDEALRRRMADYVRRL